jgi:hypothetical protein
MFRIRVMLATDASLRDPDKPNEVADSRVSEVHEDLKIEIRGVSTIYKEIRSRVMTDPDHLPLAKFDSANDKKRFKQKYAKVGTPEKLRELMVLSVVWYSTGQDPLLIEPANPAVLRS